MSIFPTRQIKEYVNSLLCPICKCGLEGTPNRYGVDQRYSGTEHLKLTCVENPGHYSHVMYWDTTADPIIVYHNNQILEIDIKKRRYRIEKVYVQNIVQWTKVVSYHINGDGDILDSLGIKSVSIPEDCFDFTTFNQEKIIKRLKTILMFA